MNVTLRNKESYQERRNKDSYWGFLVCSSGRDLGVNDPGRPSEVSAAETRVEHFPSTFITHPGRLLILLWTSKCAPPTATGGQTGSKGCLQLHQPAVQMCRPQRCCSRRV